jgi:hypothetical protein
LSSANAGASSQSFKWVNWKINFAIKFNTISKLYEKSLVKLKYIIIITYTKTSKNFNVKFVMQLISGD